MAAYIKDSDEYKKYGFNYISDSRVVVASSWELDSELVKHSESFSDNHTYVIVGGGIPGKTYNLVNTAELDDGQVYQESMRLFIREA